MRTAASVGWLTVLALLGGCPTREVSRLNPGGTTEVITPIPVDVNNDLDILFVIDNSISMYEEQQSLAANFPKFMEVLEQIEGGLPNVHIGVVSSSMGVGVTGVGGCPIGGDGGELQASARAAGCTPPDGNFISDVVMDDGVTRSVNYSGTLADTFSCIARLGTAGCGFEQHLESMDMALSGHVGANSGFLRDSAYLAVIILADEDDCSAADTLVFDPSQDDVTAPLGKLDSYRCTEFGVNCCNTGGAEDCTPAPIGRNPVDFDKCEPRGDSYLYHPQHYVDRLKALKPDDDKLVIVATIAGQPTPFGVTTKDDGSPELKPSCVVLNDAGDEIGRAAPAVRLGYFRDQFPERNAFQSICSENLEGSLKVVADLLARVLGTPCLGGDIVTDDISPAPGLQLNCQVSDVRHLNEADQEDTVIRRCDMVDDDTPVAGQELPCWWVQVDREHCAATPTGLSLMVERGEAEPPSGTTVMAYCVGEGG